MHQLVEWNKNLDLDSFYKEAENRGYVNNSNQHIMIDCFRDKKFWNAWILYYYERPVGSVVVHSLEDIFDEHSFRISRVCVFSESNPNKGLLTTKKMIYHHQNHNSQFFIPKCIEYIGSGSTLYATTNESKEATQRLIHALFMPGLQRLGVAEKLTNMYYRGLNQTFWKFYSEKFMDSLNSSKRWS